MKRRILASLACLGLPWIAGCKSYCIREGIWELSFDLQETLTRVPLGEIIPRHVVKIQLEKAEDGEGETAEITFLTHEEAAGSTSGQRPRLASLIPNLYADIRYRDRGQPPSVQIVGYDANWEFSLRGVVRNPEYIEGRHAGARSRGTRQPMILEGTWSLRWLRPE